MTAALHDPADVYSLWDQLSDSILTVLKLLCGYVRLPSFRYVFRCSFAAIDRMMGKEEMAISTEVLEHIQKLRTAFDSTEALWPELRECVRCSNPKVRSALSL